MDIEEIGVICEACVIEVLDATGGLDEPAVEYVIGVLCVVCELSATDELFAVVPTIVGLTVVAIGFGTNGLVSGYGVAGGGKGVQHLDALREIETFDLLAMSILSSYLSHWCIH